ncbi:MAG: DNA methyltransferase [Pyrinomonadaceae bacterium]
MIIKMHASDAGFTDDLAAEFTGAVHNSDPVTGLTHTFYRYPARFSPLFARAAIKAFTQLGDVVLDSFMGGGTSIVEGRVLGRRAVGTDISELATFISRVKTTPLSMHDLSTIRDWADTLVKGLNLRNTAIREEEWIEDGYQYNINGRKTWPIRKTFELILARVKELPYKQQQNFVRCVLLRSGQWALDSRKELPTAEAFRRRFFQHLAEMIEGAREYSIAVRIADNLYQPQNPLRTICLNRSVIGIENDRIVSAYPSPKLILTSPPYPGVYMLYHRWKVQGRKETPAPFWIANCLDGNGISYYTFGDRKQRGLTSYFNQVLSAFSSLARLANADTWIVQIVGFSNPAWQLPKYLSVMEQGGFTEIQFKDLMNSPDGRLWRNVPNRKWYAAYQQSTKATSQEVVLFHRLKNAILKPQGVPKIEVTRRFCDGFQIIY